MNTPRELGDWEFLTWIYHRLVEVHGENPSYDYMHRLKSIIDAIPAETQEALHK
jgi:hypothetical protein